MSDSSSSTLSKSQRKGRRWKKKLVNLTFFNLSHSIKSIQKKASETLDEKLVQIPHCQLHEPLECVEKKERDVTTSDQQSFEKNTKKRQQQQQHQLVCSPAQLLVLEQRFIFKNFLGAIPTMFTLDNSQVTTVKVESLQLQEAEKY